MYQIAVTTAALLISGTIATSKEATFEDLFFSGNTFQTATSFKIPITREMSVDRNIYTAQFRIGTGPGMVANMVLATDTEWTMFTSVNCTTEFGCSNGIYDAKKTTTEIIDNDNIVASANLNEIYMFSGQNATDTLYLSDGTIIAQEYPFFIIESVGGPNGRALNRSFPYQGILGLSPNVDDEDPLSLGVPIPLYLKQSGKIKSAVVGIDMHRETNIQSSISLGAVDATKFRNKTEKEDDLKWFQIPGNNTKYQWRHEMKNVFYSNESFDDGFVNMAVFDSFFGGLLLPTTEWTSLFESIQKNMTANNKTYLKCDMMRRFCYYPGKCADHKADFNSFFFNFIDDRAYEVKPEQYLMDTKDRDNLDVCNLGVYGNWKNNGEYVLGDVFMQSLYVILDYENSRFAINGNYISVTPTDEKKDRNEKSGMMIWIIIGSVVGTLLIITIVGFCIVKQKNKRLQANLTQYEKI